MITILIKKTVATIHVYAKKDCVKVELVYKMQMAGPVFQNKELSKYKFIYSDVSYKIKKHNNTYFAQAISALGFTIFDKDSLIVRIPFEDKTYAYDEIRKREQPCCTFSKKLVY